MKSMLMRRWPAFVLGFAAAGMAAGLTLAAPPSDDEGWRPARGLSPAHRSAGGAPAAAAMVRHQPGAGGGLQRLEYRFPAPELAATPEPGVMEVRLAGAESGGDRGAPALPVVPVRVVVPQGERLVSVRVLPGETRELAAGVTLRHVERPFPLSRPGRREARTPRDAAIYAKDDPFPAVPEKSLGERRKRGVVFAEVVLHPVRYQPLSGRVLWHPEMVVEVRTAPAAARPAGGRGPGFRARLRSPRDREAVAPLVDNPATLATYAVEPAATADVAALQEEADGRPPPLPAPLGDELVERPVLPCSEASSYRHVVVTVEALRPAFVQLAALRRRQGLSSVVVTMEEIRPLYAGRDEAEMLREFIRDAYQKWGTEHVLLGGDTAQVPARMLWVEAYPGEVDTMPSDLYFQCLDGTFNGNNDNRWGEPTDGDDGGDVDLYAEVTVGRVPAETAAEAGFWLQKTIRYETDREQAEKPAYLQGGLIVGEHLGFGGVSEYATAMMEQIRLGSSDDGYTTQGFAPFDVYTRVDTLYDSPDYTWTASELAALINADTYSVLNHLGHSSTDYCMRFTNDDADAMLRNSKPAFLYTQGCIAGAFDRDCSAEHFTTSTAHGLFGGVFNARFGWGRRDSTDGPSQRFARRFWDVFFGDWIGRTGIANQLAHERNAARIDEECMRWCYYESNLLGDPAQFLEGFAMEVRLDREAYRSDTNAVVEVTAPAIFFQGPQVVVEATMLETDGVTVVASDAVVCPLTGFAGRRLSYRSAPLPLPGLAASHGRTLRVRWLPAGETAFLEDSAPIDDLPPLITNVVVVSRNAGTLAVAWETDEQAIGGARIGVTAPPQGPEQMHDIFVTAHAETFENLPVYTRHFVAVWSEDRAGNRAWWPADLLAADPEDFAVVSTVGREMLVRYDMEHDDAGWVVGNISNGVCWQRGLPTYGPESASRCWGTIIDGRYPDGANATLVSPVVQVRDAPVISFRHWFDIEPTPAAYVSVLDADCGYIEVRSGGAWHNVGAHARPVPAGGIVTGNSGGRWEKVSVALPDSFANQPLQVRFRFLSDMFKWGRGNPAGWYIDDVEFADMPLSGLGLAGCAVFDPFPGGNGDGVAAPGENIRLQLRTYNSTDADIVVREGVFVLLIGGAPSSLVQLQPVSPAAVAYGTIPAHDYKDSGWHDVALSPLVPQGTLVTVLQTLIDAGGRIHENRASFTVRAPAAIAGRVVESTAGGDAGVSNATVTATQAGQSLTTVSDGDGYFVIADAFTNTAYRVTARRGAATDTAVVTAPTNGLLLRLGMASLQLSPATLAFSAPQGGSDGGAFTLGNAANASATLDYAIAISYQEAAGAWLSITNDAPPSGSLAPGESVVFGLRADAAALPPRSYHARIKVTSNDSDDRPDVIAVSFTVGDVLMLAIAKVRVDDRLAGDGDNLLEAGETGDIHVSLLNSNAYSGVSQAVGDLSVVDPPGGASIVAGNPLAWPWLPPMSTVESTSAVQVAFSPSPDQPQVLFRLDGADALGRPFTLFFAMTNDTRHSVTGRVETTTRLPLTPADQTSPLGGAIVTAEADDGTLLRSTPSDTNGLYRLDGLLEDAHYWFRLELPAGTPHVPPAGHDVHIDPALLVNGCLPLDFMTDNYGTNVAHLHLEDVLVDDSLFGDGDGAIDPGETLHVQPLFHNDGNVSVLSVTGMLARAVMAPARPDCMEVVAGTVATPATIPAQSSGHLAEPFTVRVAADAKPGDFQRFWVTAAVTSTPPVAWPFDFRLTVRPLHTITGVIVLTVDNTPANLAQVRVTATNTLGEVFNTTPAADGSYRLTRLTPDVAYGVMLSRVPTGFLRPGEQVIPLLDGDKTVNFLVRPGESVITPPAFNLTIAEGASTGVTFTVRNDGAEERRLALGISYRRTRDDILPAYENALAAIVASVPDDWTSLDPGRYAADEIEVRFKDGTPLPERLAYLERHGLRAVFHFSRIPAVLARPAAAGTTVAALGGPAALADPAVAYVQPSVIMKPLRLPNDPLFGGLWGLRNVRQTGGTLGADIGAEEAWNVTTGSEEIVVAVCDTGVFLQHEDLADNIWLNPLERPGDANGDGFPGERGVDDDGDAERQLRRRHPVTGEWLHEIPGNQIDDDGDGIIDETGVDFGDEDVMLADYDGDGQPHVVRGWRINHYTGKKEFYEIIDPEDRLLAAFDDDENGYIDDFHGWCFGCWTNNVNDHQDHGTHVAGTIAARGDNGRGVAGVNWRAKIMAVSLVSAGGNFTTSARIAKAMEYVMDHGVRVSNHSWGGPAAGTGLMLEVMRTGRDDNHLFVISAGNSAEDIDVIPTYPAAYSKVLDNVITVAAADHDGRLAPFSSFGDESVLLAAPGVSILSTVPPAVPPGGAGGEPPGEEGRPLPVIGDYALFNGTSMAAPHVTGAAALLWSLAPEAGYDVIHEALRQGARADPALRGWVKTGGHLDVAGAVRALHRLWLRFDGAAGSGQQTNCLLAAGERVAFNLRVNDPPALRAGQYHAEVIVDDGAVTILPVDLTVEPGAIAAVEAVVLADIGDGDGVAEPGENALLTVTLRNNGSAPFGDLHGVLVPVTPAEVAAASNSCVYGYLAGGTTVAPDRPFHVTFPPLPATNALFDLVLSDGGVPAGTLRVAVPLLRRHVIGGRVVSAANPAVGIAGARVEVWGAMGAAATTGADGAFRVAGLTDGDYWLRAIPLAAARSPVVPVAGLAGDRDIGAVAVAVPAVSLSTTGIVVAIQQGTTSNVAVTVANSRPADADRYRFRLVVSPRRRVALIADGDTLGVLRAPLRQMGFEVDWHTNNFRVLHYFNPATGYNEVRQYVAHTWDDALLSRYDFIIADVSGPDGKGRPFADYEAAAFRVFLERGGQALFTGVNPLSRPDNEELAALLGLAANAADRVAATSGQATAPAALGGVFVSLPAGASLATAAGEYDLAAVGPASRARPLMRAGPANKLLRNGVGAGTAWLWSGNPADADWRDEGAWQDLLRNILWETLAADAPVTWLAATPAAGTNNTTLRITLNGDRQALPGTYRATVALLGAGDAEEVRPVQVTLTVTPPALRVHNASGRVVDWGGRPLRGNGGERSCLFQIVWAGPDGVPDPPNADGSPGGDDQPLAAFVTGQAFGRFGTGYEDEPDTGRFDTLFAHHFQPGTPGIVLYARAWDAATFDAAMAYGDSAVRHTLQYRAGESADFGAWSVTNIVSGFRDSNGDGIPDKWTVAFRPDLDPRAPVAPLASRAVTTPTNQITGLATPARLVAAPGHLYVTERDAHRIGVFNRATGLRIANFGSQGALDGQFNGPNGIAADPRPGRHRFAVADQQNNRVQVFAYDPVSGAVTFEFKFGTASAPPSPEAPNGTFAGPRAVAIAANGDLIVADTGNQRLQYFDALGGFLGRLKLAADNATVPEGLCRDIRSAIPGAWVADAHDYKNRVAFYAVPGSGVNPAQTIAGIFSKPVDAQVWQVGARKRLCVADRNASRLRITDMNGAILLDVGYAQDPSLQPHETLYLPYGVTPVPDSRRIYVVDQGKNRVVWYDIHLDADGDGMDDIWEDLHGLDSTRNDALADPDGDGLPNIGEFRAGTDPRNPDSDGDGGGDLYEMVNLHDPLSPDPSGHHPARLLAITADPPAVVTGGVTTVKAVYNQAPAEPVTAFFFRAADGAAMGSLPMLPDAGGTNFVCHFQASADELGRVDVEVRSTGQDPPTVVSGALFRIYYPLEAVVTCLPEAVVQGETVVIAVDFAEAVLGTPAPLVELTGAVSLAPTAMSRIAGTRYQHLFPTPPTALGTVTATVSAAVSAVTGETMAPRSATFNILRRLGDIVQVPVTNMTFTPAPPTLRLWWRTETAPGETHRFEVQHAGSLVPPPPDWRVLGTSDVSHPAATGFFDVILTNQPPLHPLHNFFRIRRFE